MAESRQCGTSLGKGRCVPLAEHAAASDVPSGKKETRREQLSVLSEATFTRAEPISSRVVADTAISFASPARPEASRRGAEGIQMKFLHRMNENPSNWFLLAGGVGIVVYIAFLVVNGIMPAAIALR